MQPPSKFLTADHSYPLTISSPCLNSSQALPLTDRYTCVVRLIPASIPLTLTQYIHGSISEITRKSIYEYTKRVGEIVLTDGLTKGEGELSHDIFICLAQLQVPGLPLFPSLYTLRIMNANTSLAYLRLFVSPSLRKLEIIGVPEDRSGPLLAFMKTAAVEVPDLRALVLGPGRLSQGVLDTCLAFGCLQSLDLVNSVSSMHPKFLEALGRLESLETLNLDVRNTTYIAACCIRRTENGTLFKQEEEELHRRHVIEARAQSLADEQAAKAYQKTERKMGKKMREGTWTDANEKRLYRLQAKKTAREKESQLLLSKRQEEVRALRERHDGIRQSSSDTSGYPSGLFASLNSLHVRGGPDFVEDLVNYVSSPSLRDITLQISASLTVGEPLESIRTRVMAHLCNSTVDLLAERWGDTLEGVAFTLEGCSTPSHSLSQDAFQRLASLPKLEYLEVEGCVIGAGATDKIGSLVTSPALKVLRLPYSTPANDTPLSQLQHIAIACPSLTAVRCRLDIMSPVPVNLAPISHNLEVLTVGNSRANHDAQAILRIARYLDLLFPNLKEIAIVEGGEGNTTNQWKAVHDVVKMYQAARTDERIRMGML